MQVKERILQKAKEMCFRFGIRSVTMDDIAKELGISKKTIYLNFTDKDEIVYQIMLHEMHRDKSEWYNLANASENVLDKMLKAQDLMRQSLAGLNPSVVFEVKRYHPRAWSIFEEHKTKFILEVVTNDILAGVKEGLFRNNLNVEFLARYRMAQVEMGFNPELFSTTKFNIAEIQTTLLDHFIRGILTEDGLHKYNLHQKSF